MQTRLESNIWKYTILLITNKRVFVAVLGAYYLTIPNVGAAEIGYILMAGSIASFILEVPSGYIADTIGHKKALVLSKISILISTLFFLFADSLTLLILGGVFLSASQAFLSGTGSAFMHETLRGLGREADFTKVVGRVRAIGFAIPIVFMVAVPFLVEISFKAPFVVGLMLDAIGLIVALWLVTPPVPQETIEELGPSNFKTVIQEGRTLHFFRYACFFGIVSGVLFGVGGFKAPYQTLLEIPIIYFGVFFGIGRMLASLLLAYSENIKKHFSLLGWMRFEILLYTALIGILGFTAHPTIVVIVLLLTNGFQWGFSQISESFMVEIIRTSRHKATLLSTKSLVNSFFAGVTSLGLGWIITVTSYQEGYHFLTVAFAAILIPFYFIIRKTTNV